MPCQPKSPSKRATVWELDARAWRFWLPDGSSRLTRDRELVDMMRERHVRKSAQNDRENGRPTGVTALEGVGPSGAASVQASGEKGCETSIYKYHYDMKSNGYALRLEPDDRKQLDAAAKATHASLNQLILLCIRRALPGVCAGLSPENGRVTNVEPLSRAELDLIYSQPEQDEAGIRAFSEAQDLSAAR